MATSSKRSKLILAGVLFAILAVVTVVVVATGEDEEGSGVSTDLSVKPEIEASSEPPPTELEIDDVVEGDGETAEAGDQVTVEYVGVDYVTGEEFDTSWGGEPFPFQLGSGGVIPGWDEGVAGMKVGGRRQLTIPPDLAYGPQGQPPDIGPNATLVFVVDLVDVQKAQGGAGG